MKKSLFIIIIILLSVSYIYIKGEKEMNAALSGYTEIGFENSVQSFDMEKEDFSAFTFFVNNKEKNDISAQIEFSINDEIIQKKTENFPANKKTLITPDENLKKIILEKIQISNNPIVYKIKITWEKDKEDVIGKNIQLYLDN